MLLSNASLILLLIIYSLLPPLRNVPGVIVMNYSGTLLLAQIMSMFASLPYRIPKVCVLHACVVHAATLSTFCWKAALSFDLVFMLR